MLPGSLYITNNLEIVNNAIYNNCNILGLTESQDAIVNLPNMSLVSILLPPPMAMSAELDGNMQAFTSMYYQHLATKEADACIVMIIAALAKGMNLILYVPKDESQLSFSGVLVQYLFEVYGITTGSDNNTFDYNPMYNAILCTRLYLHEYITYQDFLVLYPVNIPIMPESLPHLINDLGPMAPCLHSEVEFLNFFNMYKNDIKQSGNNFLQIPITIRG